MTKTPDQTCKKSKTGKHEPQQRGQNPIRDGQFIPMVCEACGASGWATVEIVWDKPIPTRGGAKRGKVVTRYYAYRNPRDTYWTVRGDVVKVITRLKPRGVVYGMKPSDFPGEPGYCTPEITRDMAMLIRKWWQPAKKGRK